MSTGNGAGVGSDPSETKDLAHVLCVDIVGYSSLSTDRQILIRKELEELVQGAKEYQKQRSTEEAVRVLTAGDAVGLVFFRDFEAPARCALEIAAALRSKPHINLRMGINTGVVIRDRDIMHALPHATGDGVNMGFRVMECASPGEVWVEKSSAALLRQSEAWSGRLEEIGQVKAKNNRELWVYRLRLPSISPSPNENLLDAPATKTRPLRIVLLYKRNADPDDHVLSLLEHHLHDKGHKVFVDRHLAVGMRWAREIERQIRESDAIVILLSKTSVQSEMLAEEVQTAHESMQETGKPHLLPIRLEDEDALPEAIARILDPLQYGLWKSPKDDRQLLSELDRALISNGFAPITPRVPVPRAKQTVPAGGLPPDYPRYVSRPSDAEFFSAINVQESIVLVKGARQVGKTSLLARGLDRAHKTGAKVAVTDFQKLSKAQLNSPESVFRAMADSLAKNLGARPLPADAWTNTAAASTFEDYLTGQILGSFSSPLVWALDEVDALFTRECCSEVFAVIRSWHNNRTYPPYEPWDRLTLLIGFATEAHLFISDLNTSPFNVGIGLTLRDFTLEEVGKLNALADSPLRSETELMRFFDLVGGHPYLSHRGIYEIARQRMAVDTFARTADRDEGVFGDHLRRILMLLILDEKERDHKKPSLSTVLRQMLAGRECPRDAFYRLRSGGVLSGESAATARFRCQIYRDYVARHLREEDESSNRQK